MSLKFDLSDFQRVARRLNGFADQIPFALSQALNDGAEMARKELIERTWPTHMNVRNKRFLGAALTLKGNRATKRNLRVAIVDQLGRSHLAEHGSGGTKSAKKRLAIPPSAGSGAVRRTSKGVSASQKPTAIIGNTPKRALRVTSRGIFVGEGGKLNLRFAFTQAARIKPDVPFQADFERVMKREVAWAFGIRIVRAMPASRR